MRIKRFVCVALTLVFMGISAGAALAVENPATRAQLGQQNRTAAGSENLEKRQERVELRQQHRQRLAQVRENHQLIKELQANLKAQLAEIRSELKELRKNPDITMAEVAAIKEKLRLIRENRAVLAGSIGKIRSESVQLRVNRQNKDDIPVSNSLNNILTIQQARITLLQNLNKDAAALLGVLTQ